VSRASDRISELDKVYRGIQEDLQKLNILDISNNLAALLDITYDLKIESKHEKHLDKSNIINIIDKKAYKIDNEVFKKLIDNVKDIINKYPIQHKREVDELINALLHYMVRTLFSKHNINILLDIVEPDIRVKMPGILHIFSEYLYKSRFKSMFSFEPDSYMFAYMQDKTSHIFLEYKIHKKINFETLFLESSYTMSKFTMFMGSSKMLTGDSELIVRCVKDDRYLISRRVILIILHVTHTSDIKEVYEKISIRCARVREPSILKDLNVRLIVYTIFLDDIQDTCRYLSEFCKLLCNCLAYMF